MVALTPEIYSIHGGPFVLSLEGRREHTFLWLFCSAGLFFRLLSFLRKAKIIHVAWTVPPLPPALSDGGFTPQSKCLLGSPSAFFSQTSELNQVSFHPSVFLFLLFFKRSCVSAAPRLTSLPPFSIFLWTLTLYVPLSLLAPSVFPLLLTSFPPHVHVPRCLRCRWRRSSQPACHHASLEGTARTALLRYPPPLCFCCCPLCPTAQGCPGPVCWLAVHAQRESSDGDWRIVKAEGSAGTRR